MFYTNRVHLQIVYLCEFVDGDCADWIAFSSYMLAFETSGTAIDRCDLSYCSVSAETRGVGGDCSDLQKSCRLAVA